MATLTDRGSTVITQFGCEFNSRIMTVAEYLYLLLLHTSVACQNVSFSYTEAVEFPWIAITYNIQWSTSNLTTTL